MQNVMQIATNAGHTAQNDSHTMQNVMLAVTHLIFDKNQKGG